MQYPPQQPSANYPPAEVYVQEQAPFAGMQYQPSAPLRQSEEIAIGYNRLSATIQLIVCAAGLIVLIAFLPIMLIANFASGPFEPEDTLPLLVTIFILFAGIAFVSWITWGVVAHRRSRKPVLFINHEGIAIERVFLMRKRFISWTEIASIYQRNMGYKYFCIQKKRATFGALVMVPQMYLEKPVEEILQRVYHMYSSELSYHNVQLRF